MSIKIQINSLEALERLLGDEETMEIEVRKSVIEGFAKGFVKSATTSKEIAKEVNELKEGAKVAAVEYAQGLVGGEKRNGWSTSVELHDDVKEKIRRQVNMEFAQIVEEEVRAKTAEVKEYINKRVDGYIESYVRKALNKEVILRINTAIEAALDEALEE